MPVQNTTKLGLQEDSATGKISGFQGLALAGNGMLSFTSDTYIQQQSGTLNQTALWVAATSGQYLVNWSIEISSVSVTNATLTPKLRYWTYGTGTGLDMFTSSINCSATQKQAYSGSLWIRTAASTVFLSVEMNGTVGVPPLYNMNVSVFQASS